MTTQVTVHGAHDTVEVMLIDLSAPGPDQDIVGQTANYVEPGETRIFHIWDTRAVVISERKPEPKEPDQ